MGRSYSLFCDSYRARSGLALTRHHTKARIVLSRVAGCQPPDIIDFLHDHSGAANELVTSRSQSVKTLSLANKKLKSKFFFE